MPSRPSPDKKLRHSEIKDEADLIAYMGTEIDRAMQNIMDEVSENMTLMRRIYGEDVTRQDLDERMGEYLFQEALEYAGYL